MKPELIEKKTADMAVSPNHGDEIRRRAYEIYEARGREPGHDLDDGLLAEAEISGIEKPVAA